MENNLHQEDKIEKSFDLSIIKRLLTFAKSSLWMFGLCLVMLLIITVIDLAFPLLMKVAIDDYIRPTHHYYEMVDEKTSTTVTIDGVNYLPTSKESADATMIVDGKEHYMVTGQLESLTIVNQQVLDANEVVIQSTPLSDADYDALRAKDKVGLWQIAGIFVALLLANFILNYGQIFLLNYASQRVIYQMREALFKHVTSLNLGFFDKNPVGRLVTRITNDMNNINEMFTNVLTTFFKDILLLVGTMVIMLSINWRLALICLATVPFVIIAASIFRVKAREVQRDVKVKLAKINATLSENISGMKIIQLFNQEERMAEEFDEINKDHYHSNIRETQVYAIFRPTMHLAYSTSLALLIWFGGGSYINGAVELGVLIAFVQYTEQFFRPIFDLSEKFNIMQSAMASSERVFMLLDETNPIEDPKFPKCPENIKGDIAFDNVEFSYSGDAEDNVLKGISFDVKAGETVALVGSTGSGKTTIISLLNRFYDIQKGSITLDGVDIKDMHKDVLRHNIGMVLQDVFLFAGDIKQNIKLNHETMTLEEIKRVATFVNANHFIEKLPDGYDSEVQERGSTLSSGQRQLLSFARALAYDPRILILDEATSNIDTETEQLIQDAITKLIKGRTTFIVAHRLSTIQHADKIIVMHKGEIKEVGNHEELLAHQGIYHNLYKLQYANESA